MFILKCVVVQSWISANHGLRGNMLFWFVYFCMSVYFKPAEDKTSIDPDKTCEKIFSRL